MFQESHIELSFIAELESRQLCDQCPVNHHMAIRKLGAERCPSGDLLYPLVRTGPVVPAHTGDDQERVQAEREFLEGALCPAWLVAMLLRARRS